MSWKRLVLTLRRWRGGAPAPELHIPDVLRRAHALAASVGIEDETDAYWAFLAGFLARAGDPPFTSRRAHKARGIDARPGPLAWTYWGFGVIWGTRSELVAAGFDPDGLRPAEGWSSKAGES